MRKWDGKEMPAEIKERVESMRKDLAGMRKQINDNKPRHE